MYDVYIKTWKQYAKQYGDTTCLFYLVGKFYEMYDILDKTTGIGQTNVKQAVEALGITLTTKEKDGPKGEDCYFAGFPEQSLQKFAAMMTRDGWTVVVCDQEKDGKGKVTGRPVARIFSPGTHIEVAGAEAPYLAGLWVQEQSDAAPTYAAAVLDMCTGSLVSFECKAQGNAEIWSADELVHFFQIYSPRETVLWWQGAPLGRPSEAVFRRRCGLPKGSLHLESGLHQGTLEVALVRKSYLETVFSSKLGLLPILEQLHLHNKPLTERVLVSLLRFAEDHLPSAIQNLQEHTIWTPETSVYMGNNTLLQLNYISSGSEQSVLSLLNKALTSLGKRAMVTRLLTPSSDREEISRKLKEVEYFYTLQDTVIKRIESILRLIHDMARLHRKITMYTVNAADILALDTSYGCVNDLIQVLEGTCLGFDQEKLISFEKYLTLFKSHFDIEKAKLALKEEDKSFLPLDKAPKVNDIEKKIQGIKDKVNDHIETLRQWIGLPPDTLRLECQETSSYVITATKTTLAIVKKKLQSSSVDQYPFPGITVHERKTSRGTVEFPLLDTYHYQTFGLRNQLQQAIKEELPPICNAVQNTIWSYVEQWVSHIDVSLALAKVAKERGYVKPEVVESDESGLFAIGLRHPLLESIQTKLDYVKHDVSLGFEKENGWLLYGMNASGKSSLMKSIGINVLLAQAGCYVPATTFKIKPFKSVLTRILNQDSIWAGLSSFAVEISELRDIFMKANHQSLILGDELCSGTESVSATSLVAAGIKHLHDQRSRFVFATHLHDLNKLSEISALSDLGIWHLRVHYDAASDKLVYDRSLHRGPGGTLYGLEVARAMHLPLSILKQAQSYRRTLLGEAALEVSETSSWNSSVLRKCCEVCKNSITRELEVHHIIPRANAINGRLEDGTSMNKLSNLIVVCQECHDKHHRGELEIGPQKLTSSGPERIVTTAPAVTHAKKVKVKWSEEEMATIENYLRKYPHLPISRLVYDLKHQEDIEITARALTNIRNSLA